MRICSNVFVFFGIQIQKGPWISNMNSLAIDLALQHRILYNFFLFLFLSIHMDMWMCALCSACVKVISGFQRSDSYKNTNYKIFFHKTKKKANNNAKKWVHRTLATVLEIYRITGNICMYVRMLALLLFRNENIIIIVHRCSYASIYRLLTQHKHNQQQSTNRPKSWKNAFQSKKLSFFFWYFLGFL